MVGEVDRTHAPFAEQSQEAELTDAAQFVRRLGSAPSRGAIRVQAGIFHGRSLAGCVSFVERLPARHESRRARWPARGG